MTEESSGFTSTYFRHTDVYDTLSYGLQT